MIRHLLLSAVVLCSASATLAEDDLLSILDGSNSAETESQKNAPHWLAPLLSANNGEQNIFLGLFVKGEWEKALYHWPVAFAESDFARSETGQALHAYLLYRNQLKVTGLEQLLAIAQPAAIAAPVLRVWREAVTDQDALWSLINPQIWKSEWAQVWGNAVELRLKSRGKFGPENIEELTELLKKTTPNTPERARLQWQLALALGFKDEAGSAAKILSNLMTAQNNPIPNDLMTITAARLLYQNGFLDAANRYYQKVPKASEYFLDAQEELAWSYMRKGQAQDTVALTQTVVHPVFAARVGPEAVFLRAMAQLKVCDYPGVADSLKVFRERYRKRAAALTSLTQNPQQPSAEQLAQRLIAKDISMEDMGRSALELPRFITRDDVFRQLVRAEAALRGEAKVAGDLYVRTQQAAAVGFQGAFEVFKKQVESRAQVAREARLNRVKELAQDEIGEIAKFLQKMHIVEAEVLQQITLAERTIKASSQVPVAAQKGTTGSQARDKVSYPFEGETWFDEIAQYKVDIKKGCQAKAK